MWKLRARRRIQLRESRDAQVVFQEMMVVCGRGVSVIWCGVCVHVGMRCTHTARVPALETCIA